MKHFLKYILLVLPLLVATNVVFAQSNNVFSSPDNSFSLIIPSSWERIPQESIDKVQELAGDSGKSASILAGFGEVSGGGFNPYIQIFNSKKLNGAVNEQTLNSKANEIQKTFQAEIDKNTELQNKVGMTNSLVESANVDSKNGIVSLYMVSDISNDSVKEGTVIEGKLYMLFGKQEYVMLGFYNLASSMGNRKLNGNNDLTKLVDSTVSSFSFSEAHKYNPNAINTGVFNGVLEKGITGAITGVLFALFIGLFSMGKKKKVQSPLDVTKSLNIDSTKKISTKSKMKLKPLLLIIFALISIGSGYYLFTSLTANNSNEKVEKKAENGSEVSDSDNFQKKISCEKVINPIKEELEQKEMERLASSTSLALLTSERFNFGFYSPTTDSCLYVTFLMTNIGEREDSINIYDALTKRRLYKFPNDGVGGSNFAEYTAKISELSNGEIQIQ